MAISICGQTGGNTGGVKCAVSPGKPQNWAIWGGFITPAELEVAADLKSALVEDSKLSKTASAKLFLMPGIQNKENKREANQETTLSNGLKIVTREGLPGFRWSFFTSQQQLKQLRKFNGLQVPVIFDDDNKRTWGAVDADGNFIGRQAIVQFEGMTALADDAVQGMAYVDIAFIDRSESYDDQYFIETPFSWQSTFAGLIDVQLTNAAAVSTVSGDKVLHIGLEVDAAEAGNPVDLYSNFSASALGTNEALWKVTKVSDGSNVTVDQVDPNAAGYFDLNIGAASAGSYKVELVAPEDLDALNVVGIESVSVTIVVS